ncbi:hypothetical protein [Spiroplasma endosymbiont of Apeira syringaria]|uniref:hypothetical protein n=1 Tax=Spiroplasma endosymbiont of Apeira syringaria TaxID=3066307 RepID=UPI0030CE9C3F
MQDIAVQFEKHFWIHSVSLFPPQVHVGRSPLNILKEIIDLQGQLYENKVNRYKEIFEQLDFILKNKNFEELENSIYPSKKNPFEEDGDTELFDSISFSAIQIKDLEQKIFDFEEKNK